MATLVVLFIGGLIFLWYFLTYNSLIAHRNAADQSWSNIEVELKRRFDLIQNLVAVVKGYAAHERETLERVTALRARGDEIAERLHDPAEAAKIEGEYAKALTRLVAIAEAYPTLKADQQYLALQKELTETENRIAEQRSGYNHAVNRYRNMLESFPSSFVAAAHSFGEKAFFDAPDELVEPAPKVSIP